MSFLPSMKPGNIRAPITTSSKYFGNTNDTFHYSPSRGQIAINKTNPCSGNTEIVAGVLKIYEPHRFGAPDSPNFIDTTTNNGLNAQPLSGLGHNNHLNVKIGISNGSDNNFRINYDESPAAVFHTLAEGSHAYNYNYYNMKSSTTAKDDRGVYRQAAFRIVHSAANEGSEEACFNQLDFNDPSTVDNIYAASDHDPIGCTGNGITDLHIKLTDKSSGSQSCNIGIGDSHALKNCEQLDIQNTANRRARSGLDNSSSSGGAEFYRDMKALIDPGDAPYFDTGTLRNNTFRRL